MIALLEIKTAGKLSKKGPSKRVMEEKLTTEMETPETTARKTFELFLAKRIGRKANGSKSGNN
tara:strand:- start:9248 stop:9436 length:189 start_codon:yes stop_codon:yes gene_type:complete